MPPERWLYTVPLRLRALFLRRQLDQELEEELQAHLEERTDQYIEQGMSAEEAHYAALREFGNVELAKQNCRDARKVLWVQNFIEDVRFAARMLCKDPGFAVIAVLTLGLGIGANTAIFSVVNTVLLRPLPYREPSRLVFLSESGPGMPMMYISLANLADWRAKNTVFESMGGYRRVSATLTGHGDPQRLLLGPVTAGLFATLGVEPVLGRVITEEEDKPGAAPVVVLSDTLWAREFGHDPTIVGKKLKLDGKWYTVIGVFPNSRLPLYWRQIDAFTSLGQLENEIGGPKRRAFHLGVLAYARLKPGVSLEQARAQMQAIARQLEQQYPQTNSGQGVAVQPLLQKVVGEVSHQLKLLMGAVALVLLIACANVANLLTSRSLVRRREIAIRRALGAGPIRLAVQLLCESTMLALAGGLVGLLAAYCAATALAHTAVSIMPRIEDISIDLPVLIFTFSISLATGLIFGVVPALAAYRSNPAEAFHEDGSTPGPMLRRMNTRSMLATAELAMALVLLVGAGLTLKSLYRVLQADLGLQTNDVLTGVLNLPEAKYKNDQQLAQAVHRLLQKISSLPSLTAAGFQTPQLGVGSQVSFHIEDQPKPEDGKDPYSDFSSVTPGALEAMGVRLLNGRFFNWDDNPTAPPVCIIDDSMAAQYFPGKSPLGKRIITGVPAPSKGGRPGWTIVGVVHRMKTDPADPQQLPETFISYAQYPDNRGRLIVHSQQDRATLLPALLKLIHSIDGDLPLYDVRTLSDLVDENVATRRLLVTLLSVFAGIALLLAGLGVYGVMAYMVAGRTREIGVRLALGAKRRDILRLILGQAMPVVLLGAGVGIFVSLCLKDALSAWLFGVSATDPSTIVGVAGLLIAAALAACLIPLRRAIAIDPVIALRRE